jgi:thiol:disulfide interchange protein DsbA
MKKLLLLTAMAALSVACSQKNSGTATTTPAAEPAAQQQAPAPVAAPTDAELKQQAAAAQESASAEAGAGDASLERIAAMPENVQLPSGRWKSGTHYRPIVPAQATSAGPGQVEVLEFMWLGCQHCAHLEPFIVSWAVQKPAYVKFVQEHVMWGAVHRAHGKLLYTLQALGRTDLVPKAFDEIHRNGKPLLSASGNDADTQSIQLAFAKASGISEADFKREYSGFAVNTRLQRAEELNRRYRIESVPTIIINGKYLTDVGMAGGEKELVQLITDLAAIEKGR